MFFEIDFEEEEKKLPENLILPLNKKLQSAGLFSYTGFNRANIIL